VKCYGVADQKAPLPICHAEFDRSALKGVGIKNPQNWEPWNSVLSEYVATSNLVVLIVNLVSKGVFINRREPPKMGGAAAPPPCGWRVADPLETRCSPMCVILPNLIVLGKTVRALLRTSA